MFEFIKPILDIGSAIYAKSQADKAASQARAIGEKNAQIILRDIEIAQRQIDTYRQNLEISNERKTQKFGAVQGSVINLALGRGMTSRGSPQDILIDNASEFEYELAIDAYNTEIAIMEQEDLKEEARLRAEVARMGGNAEASALRAKGTTALLSGIGSGISQFDQLGAFDDNANLFGKLRGIG